MRQVPVLTLPLNNTERGDSALNILQLIPRTNSDEKTYIPSFFESQIR